MHQPLIITIGREYGSGGREIGQAVAKKLGISFYDKEIINLAAEKSGLSHEFIASNEQRVKSGLVHNLSASAAYSGGFFSHHYLPLSESIFISQAQVIRDIANKKSAVIVGRCADYILSERKNTINVFIHAPIEARVERRNKGSGNYEKIARRAAQQELKRMEADVPDVTATFRQLQSDLVERTVEDILGALPGITRVLYDQTPTAIGQESFN